MVVLAFVASGLAQAGTAPAYDWQPQAAPMGPVVVVVSLEEQRAHVYRNGISIGSSPISSGRRGHRTPTGVFTILQKEIEHHSNLYDDAPMPYMERLTWDGIALHGGTLPGYPASHGCVRLPQGFAERLFAVSRRGDTVVISDAQEAAPDIVHPAVLAPVTPLGEPANLAVDLDKPTWWDETAAPDGPISMLVSLADRRVHVLRNGVRIGSAAVNIAEGFSAAGAAVFIVAQSQDDDGSAGARHRWMAYPIRGDLATIPLDVIAAHLRVPDEFLAHIQAVLAPGASVMITDQPALRVGGGSAMTTVLQSSSPDAD